MAEKCDFAGTIYELKIINGAVVKVILLIIQFKWIKCTNMRMYWTYASMYLQLVNLILGIKIPKIMRLKSEIGASIVVYEMSMSQSK